MNFLACYEEVSNQSPSHFVLGSVEIVGEPQRMSPRPDFEASVIAGERFGRNPSGMAGRIGMINAGLYLRRFERRTMGNVFDAILQFGHDEDYAPRVTGDFSPTDAPAGSQEKLDVLARRIAMGLPLWHPEDRSDYSGLTGAVRPRE